MTLGRSIQIYSRTKIDHKPLFQKILFEKGSITPAARKARKEVLESVVQLEAELSAAIKSGSDEATLGDLAPFV